jgi:choline dehydrogenase
VGVAYLSNGREEIARAGREVLLCGGTVNSPQLLMLSGVGPVDHLKTLAIPILADLPGVGSNLQDHLAVGVVHACTQPVSLASAESLRNILGYLLFHRGPRTSNVAEVGGFLRTRPERTRPDLEVLFVPVYFLGHGFTDPLPRSGHGFTLAAILLYPASRGRITLRSSNPSDYPCIQANYLSAETDVQVLVEGMKFCRTLTQSPAFDAYRGAEIAPGPPAQSDRTIAEAMRACAETLYHPVGTCKMGSDAMAVVDDQLRVRGVEGLRVVDASIIPQIVGGHTNAPTIMIAEKAADLIRSRTKLDAKAGQAASATHVE